MPADPRFGLARRVVVLAFRHAWSCTFHPHIARIIQRSRRNAEKIVRFSGRDRSQIGSIIRAREVWLSGGHPEPNERRPGSNRSQLLKLTDFRDDSGKRKQNAVAPTDQNSGKTPDLGGSPHGNHRPHPRLLVQFFSSVTPRFFQTRLAALLRTCRGDGRRLCLPKTPSAPRTWVRPGKGFRDPSP